MLGCRHFQFQHHDGDDDGKHAISERFQSGFMHVLLLRRGK
jgi:hypothetical protein